MRLPNGYGSVYKLSGNRRNPWAVAVFVDTPTGRVRKIIGIRLLLKRHLLLFQRYMPSGPMSILGKYRPVM